MPPARATPWRDAGAEFSEDGAYRHRLWRLWGDGPCLMVIGLNPSTADATTDDPTVRRCLCYARDWGYAGLRMANVFGLRATDPRVMLAAADPTGPATRAALLADARRVAAEGGGLLAAWGNHGAHRGTAGALVAALEGAGHGVACLGRTGSGAPRHPLYLRRDARPEAYLGDGGSLIMERSTRWRCTR